jgi:hypothetical protein
MQLIKFRTLDGFNMYIEGKYLLVNYRDIPHVDFICENGGDLRIRVTKLPESRLDDRPQGVLCEVADKCVFIFENISNRIIEEQDELVRAIHWYKSRFGFNR